jgi:hypothetical protein
MVRQSIEKARCEPDYELQVDPRAQGLQLAAAWFNAGGMDTLTPARYRADSTHGCTRPVGETLRKQRKTALQPARLQIFLSAEE